MESTVYDNRVFLVIQVLGFKFQHALQTDAHSAENQNVAGAERTKNEAKKKGWKESVESSRLSRSKLRSGEQVIFSVLITILKGFVNANKGCTMYIHNYLHI